MTEGTKSGHKERGSCSGVVNYKGDNTQCKRTAVTKDADSNWWCGLHDPIKVAQREAKKKHEAEQKAQAQAIPEHLKPVATGAPEKPNIPAVVSVGTPSQSFEALDAASLEAMKVLHEIAAMRDIGWPENTPSQKYAIILGEINRKAMAAGDLLRDEIAKARQSHT